MMWCCLTLETLKIEFCLLGRKVTFQCKKLADSNAGSREVTLQLKEFAGYKAMEKTLADGFRRNQPDISAKILTNNLIVGK